MIVQVSFCNLSQKLSVAYFHKVVRGEKVHFSNYN